MPDVRSSTQVDERPAPVHCSRGSSNLLPQNPLLELVILLTSYNVCVKTSVTDPERYMFIGEEPPEGGKLWKG